MDPVFDSQPLWTLRWTVDSISNPILHSMNRWSFNSTAYSALHSAGRLISSQRHRNRASGVSWGSTDCCLTAGHALEGKIRTENCNIDCRIVDVEKGPAERLSCSRFNNEHPVFAPIASQTMPLSNKFIVAYNTASNMSLK